jgi:hypothetical protein
MTGSGIDPLQTLPDVILRPAVFSIAFLSMLGVLVMRFQWPDIAVVLVLIPVARMARLLSIGAPYLLLQQRGQVPPAGGQDSGEFAPVCGYIEPVDDPKMTFS